MWKNFGGDTEVKTFKSGKILEKSEKIGLIEPIHSNGVAPSLLVEKKIRLQQISSWL